jgi:hypothetical protein
MDSNGAGFKINEQKFSVSTHRIDGLANGRTWGWGTTAYEGVGRNLRDRRSNSWHQDRAIRLYLKQFWHN